MPSSDKRFALSLLYLFFGFWFLDFLMCSSGIVSPFRWLYGPLQTAIYFTALTIYYLVITALILTAVAAVVWVLMLAVDFFTRQPLSAHADIKSEVTTIESRQAMPLISQSNATVIEIKRPAPPPQEPPKPKLTEEEALQNVVNGLRGRW